MTAPGHAVLVQHCDELRRKVCDCRRHGDGVEKSLHSTKLDDPRDAGDEEHMALYATQLSVVLQVLSRAYPVPLPTQSQQARMGNIVILRSEDDRLSEYLIAGEGEPSEAWPGKVLLSVETPIGREVIGRRLGESFEVQTRTGSTSYEIMAIGTVDSPEEVQHALSFDTMIISESG